MMLATTGESLAALLDRAEAAVDGAYALHDNLYAPVDDRMAAMARACMEAEAVIALAEGWADSGGGAGHELQVARRRTCPRAEAAREMGACAAWRQQQQQQQQQQAMRPGGGRRANLTGTP
jgi:hypothetical protein